MDQGLYLTIRDSEQLERCLLTQKGEVRMAATTIRDELILFSELDFFPYAELLDILEIYGQAVHGSYDKPFEEVYPEYLQEMFLIIEDLVDELSESDPLHGLLTKTHLKDVVPEDDGTAMYCIYARNALLDALAEVLHFQGDVLAALDEMAETGTTDLTALGPVNAMPLFSKGQEQFFFRSVSDYYNGPPVKTTPDKNIVNGRCLILTLAVSRAGKVGISTRQPPASAGCLDRAALACYTGPKARGQVRILTPSHPRQSRLNRPAAHCQGRRVQRQSCCGTSR